MSRSYRKSKVMSWASYKAGEAKLFKRTCNKKFRKSSRLVDYTDDGYESIIMKNDSYNHPGDGVYYNDNPSHKDKMK